MPLSLGIDASTQSVSGLVIDTCTGSIVAQVSVNFGQDLPQYNAPSGFIPGGKNGEVHADPCMWLDALELMLERLGGECDLSRIEAVSGAGQQHGSVYLNAQWPQAVKHLRTDCTLAEQLRGCLSRSTSPIWMDTSTGDECREIARAVGGDAVVCSKSGSVAIERFTGPQIRRFYKSDPEAYARTARIHLVSSFLCSVLVGCDAPVDTGDGAGMNLLALDGWQWDEALLDATAPGLSGRLPSVATGNQVAGNVSPYFVQKFGFRADAQVSVFTGDNPSSLVGMGASDPGKVVISLGTSDTFFAAMPTVVADPDGYGHVFGNPNGGVMSLQCFINGSLAREAVKARFGYDWDAFSTALEQSEPGNGGDLMIPFFQPEISPRITLSAPILKGGKAFERWEQPEKVIRACVEGQFINMKLRSTWMRLEPQEIYLTGGASKSSAIAQVVADVFQARVIRIAVSESVALGAAMRAAANTFSDTLAELTARFCQQDEASARQPAVEASAYDVLTDSFRQCLAE